MLKPISIAIALCIFAPALMSQDKAPEVTTLEGLANATIELVGTDKSVKLEGTPFRPLNDSTWMIKGAKADKTAPAGFNKIRFEGINAKKLGIDLILVKLEVRKSSHRLYQIEAVRGKAEVRAKIIFNAFDGGMFSLDSVILNPLPVRGDDGVYTLTLPKPLKPGHYAVVPGLFHSTAGTAQTTASPSITGWDFDVE